MRQTRFINPQISMAILGAAMVVSARAQDDIGKYFGLDTLEPEPSWPRYFRAGAVIGVNVKAQFGVAGTFSIPNTGVGPTGVSGANHTYNDGFVNVDATGNAGGDTWNWGYQNAGQYNNGQLTFHSVDSYTMAGGIGESTKAEIGAELAYGGQLYQAGSFAVGWEIGFGWLPISISDTRTSSATITRTVHTYDASGWLNPVDAPYQGSYNGPGPLIRDTATAGSEASPPAATVNSRQELDLDLYTLRLGPMVHWEVSDHIALDLSGGFAFGALNGEFNYSDRINVADGSTANNSGSNSSTEWVYGGYISAAAMYHVEEHGDLYIAMQYMPLGETTFSGAGRGASLDLSGAVYFSVGINWPF